MSGRVTRFEYLTRAGRSHRFVVKGCPDDDAAADMLARILGVDITYEDLSAQ